MLSLYAVKGLGMLLLSTLIETAAYVPKAGWMFNIGGLVSGATIWFVQVMCSTVGMGFVVASVFVGRARPFSTARYDDPCSPLPDELTRPVSDAAPHTGYQQSLPPQ